MTPDSIRPIKGFKSKTISKILTGKFIAWSKSITDEAVRNLVEQNTIITGGSITSMLLGEQVNDFDVYFRDANTAHKVAEYYVKKLLENPPPAFKGDDKHTVKIYAKLEDEIKTGEKAMRICGMTDGPQPARVRIVVKSAGIVSGETKQTDYQYFEGIEHGATQAAATDAYVDNAMGTTPEEFAEGQITDTSEPEYEGPEVRHPNGAANHQDAVETLDDHSSETLVEGEVKPEKGGERPKYRVLFVTSSAITLSDQMQLILRFQGPPETIHENFDYQHATNWWSSWDKKLTLRPEALECTLSRELRYVGSKYPICSIIRLRKFISRGWTVNAGQIVKMAYQVSKLDMNDPRVLEDQLVGVDSAYFSQLIGKLKEKVDDKGDVLPVDGLYLMTLIDKIF